MTQDEKWTLQRNIEERTNINNSKYGTGIV